MADAELVFGARNDAQAVIDEIGKSLRGLAVPAQEGSLKADAAISSLIAGLVRGGIALTGVFGAAAISIGAIATGSAVKAIKDESEALDSLNRRLSNFTDAGANSSDSAKQLATSIQQSTLISDQATEAATRLANETLRSADVASRASNSATESAKNFARETIGSSDATMKNAAAHAARAGAATAGSAAIRNAAAISASASAVESAAIANASKSYSQYSEAAKSAIATAKEFAASTKQSLGVSEKDTINLMEQASSLGVSRDKLDEAAIAAIGLSKSLGIDLDAALKKVVESDDELVSIVDSVNAGLEEQSKSVEGLAGMWNFLERQVKMTIEFIDTATQPLQDIFIEIGTYIKESVVSGVVGAVTAVEVFREKTFESLQYAFVAWEYHSLQIEGVAAHTFTVALPAYVVWFTDNFTNLFVDGFNSIVVASMNFTEAIGQAFVALWDFIASGGAGGIEKFTNDMLLATDTLLNGFEATAEQIPKIMGRKISDQENALKSQMDLLGKGLGDSFNEKFKANMESLNIPTPQLNAADLAGLKSPDDKDAKGGGKLSQELRANEGRLLTRGKSDNALDEVAKNTKASADRLKTIEDELKRQKSTEIVFETVGARG
jgi:hypothetical protein